MAEWCWDRKRDAMDTFLRAMRMAGDDPCIHLEDDIVLAKDFYRRITNAIKDHPDNMIQFFSMRKADLEVGSRWDSNYMMNQCHYNPAGYSNLIADYWHEWKETEEGKANAVGYDTMMNRWLRNRKEKYWIHVPSLVDHRVGKSMIDPRRASTNRQSKTFTKF